MGWGTRYLTPAHHAVQVEEVQVCFGIVKNSGLSFLHNYSSNPYIMIISELRKRKTLGIFNRPLFFNFGKLLNYSSPSPLKDGFSEEDICEMKLKCPRYRSKTFYQPFEFYFLI